MRRGAGKVGWLALCGLALSTLAVVLAGMLLARVARPVASNDAIAPAAESSSVVATPSMGTARERVSTSARPRERTRRAEAEQTAQRDVPLAYDTRAAEVAAPDATPRPAVAGGSAPGAPTAPPPHGGTATAAPRPAAPVDVAGVSRAPIDPAAEKAAADKAAADRAAHDDPQSDHRPPELQWLRFDPTTVPDGDTVTITLGTSDDLSGVRRVAGSLRSPSGSATLAFNASDAGSGTEFTARVVVPKKAEAGNWWIETLYIVDNANNPFTATYTPATVPAWGVLRVVSSASDAAPPEVHRVWVERASITAGERNTIGVEAVDPDSGVESVIGAFQSPTRAATVEFYCLPGKDPATWSGSIAIPKSADCGEWTLQRLRVRDKAGNSASLAGDAPPLGRVAFTVTGDACDSTPPSLDALVLSTGAVTNDTPAEIVVTATVHDVGSGVASLMGVVNGPIATNQQVPSISFACAPLPNDPNSPWTGKFTVPQFAAKGTWRVILVRLQDRAQNRRDYSAADPVLAQASFEVR